MTIKGTRELWTRFEIVKGQYVGIKLKDGVNKIEFAIPRANFLAWMRAFASLLKDFK